MSRWLLALICAVTCSMNVAAEETSEHIMTVTSGTQVSGSVRSSANWVISFPDTRIGEVWLRELPVRELRASAWERPTPFNPLDFVPARLDAPESPRPISLYQTRPRREGVAITLVPRTPNSFLLASPDQMQFQLAAVPEPATLSLAATGLAAWLWRRSRKK